MELTEEEKKELHEIESLQKEIVENAKKAVKDAMRIGQILNAKRLEYKGEFGEWLKTYLPDLSQRTAYNYMDLFKYRLKLTSVSDFNDAYKHIEYFKSEEKKSEDEKAKERVKEYQDTGIKPDGWRRGTDDRLYEQEEKSKEYDERIRKIAADMEQEQKNYNETKSATYESAQNLVNALIESEKAKAQWKAKIKISESGLNDTFTNALLEYLEELPDDNRRIETCYNIIKICKNIAIELHGGKNE